MVTAQRLAKASPLVTAAMVEAMEFPHLVQKYGIRAVPKVVLNETRDFTGALDEADFARMVIKAGGAKS